MFKARSQQPSDDEVTTFATSMLSWLREVQSVSICPATQPKSPLSESDPKPKSTDSADERPKMNLVFIDEDSSDEDMEEVIEED